MFEEQLSSLLRLQDFESRQEVLETTIKKQSQRKYLCALQQDISN